MPTAPRLSCVVVAFHRPERLAELLAALGDSTEGDAEIVVVNVERDAGVSEVASGVVEVGLTGNPGYAAAVNAGVGRAAGAVIAFMNDDVVVDRASLNHLAGIVERGEADVAVPRILDRRGDVERTVAALPTPANLAREWMLLPDRPVGLLAGRLRVEKWRRPERAEVVDAATGALVVTSRRLLLQHPLPTAYFLYWEESDWFWQLKTFGSRVIYDPRATAVHSGGRDDVRPEKSRLMATNAVRCVRLTQGRRAAMLAVPVVVGWNLRLALTAALRRPSVLPARLAGLVAAIRAVGEAARPVAK